MERWTKIALAVVTLGLGYWWWKREEVRGELVPAQINIPATPSSPAFAYPAQEGIEGIKTIAITPKEAATGVQTLTGIEQTVTWGGSPESRLGLLTYNYAKLGGGNPEQWLERSVPEPMRAMISPSVWLEYAKSNPSEIAPGQTPSRPQIYTLGVKAYAAGFKSEPALEGVLIALGIQPSTASAAAHNILTLGPERALQWAGG